MKKVLKEIENINTNPNRLALEKFIDILAFIAENSIDYTKEYTIFYEEIKSNKMDKIDAPSLKELKLRFYSFIHIKYIFNVFTTVFSTDLKILN